MPPGHEHIWIAVADQDQGSEEVPARRLASNEWELRSTPVYATGFARGDTVAVLDSESGLVRVLSRGGNVGVHFYLALDEIDNKELTRELVARISAGMCLIGGVVECSVPGLVCCSVPLKGGANR
ncbi:MAG: DUF4265 domain-containing protein [Polyangiaceae bacterium]|nr:DUF4265 domain-containing protein [Myxococcales bacterium]MCB9583786.1 DUF4265 domain-containing protein [Polyangiaceae bacterium]